MTGTEDDSEQDLEQEQCGCDFVQIVVDRGERFELHHVIPDDGAPHTHDLRCPCDPDYERVDYDLIVVDHCDQDPQISLDDLE